jgi:hypothetical protein
MADPNSEPWQRRLSHVESELGDLKANVTGLSTAFSVFKEDQRITLAEVRELNRTLQQKSQTHWPTVISALSLVVVVGGLSLYPINEKLADFRTSQRRQWEVIREHMAIEGHAPMQIKVQALEKAVDRTRQELTDEIKDVDDDSRYRDANVDEVVQREMRILDDAMQARFDKEDERLQREMDLKGETIRQKVKALEKEINEIKVEQTRRTDRVYKRSPGS